MRDLVFEIGVEELPASFLGPALRQLESLAAGVFAEHRLQYKTLRSLGAPRRLALYVEGLEETQETIETDVLGPARRVAYDDKGEPTKAAAGFARSQGVEVSDLSLKTTDKGEYVCATVTKVGLPTQEILVELLPNLVRALEFPKSMRWDHHALVFARPIRWLLCLYGEEVVTFTLGGLTTGSTTQGNRLLSPGSCKVPSASEYLTVLRRAEVIVDPDERANMVGNLVTTAAEEVGGKVIQDDELFELVTHSVEGPSVVCGQFDERFLELPREVVTTAMKEHQMYFAVEGADGKLKPNFIAVVASPHDTGDEVRKGHERVLAARLSDAQFYWEEDRKLTPDEMVEQLSGVVWLEKLGTMLEKTHRFEALAGWLATRMAPQAESAARRAAHLCKADLVSEMIRDGKEFTKLQGIMGREYALAAGESQEVAVAVAEHYLPRFAGDILPQTPAGAAVAVADKMDSIAGCFSVGLVPSGSQDPYALRRQGSGVIRILAEGGYRLDLVQLAREASHPFGKSSERGEQALEAAVVDFLCQRAAAFFEDRGYRYDEIQAALSVPPLDLVRAELVLRAISGGRTHPSFGAVVVGYRRAANILKGESPSPSCDPKLFEHGEERDLLEATRAADAEIARLLKGDEYKNALDFLLELRSPIDRFFDSVMVMVEEESIRRNRLALLREVQSVFLGIADFSAIVLEGEREDEP